MAKVGRLDGNFIEGMMCEGGCINGAGTVVPSSRAKGAFNRTNIQATKKTVLSNKSLKEYKRINSRKIGI